jgi:hypothetical protein
MSGECDVLGKAMLTGGSKYTTTAKPKAGEEKLALLDRVLGEIQATGFFSARLTWPKDHKSSILFQKIGAPDWIRTSDPCLRRAVLYPAELRARG